MGEPAAGTASPIVSWLLVEHPGAWPANIREVVLAASLPTQRRRHLDRLWRAKGLRPFVIRRSGRAHRSRLGSGRTVIVGGSVPGRRWQERLELRDPRELADLDLDAVADGIGGLGVPLADPVLAVCTHGTKDMCCASYGRPVAGALATAYPDQLWEVSHLGGDRFAGNLLVLPHGLLYGQLDAASAVDVAASLMSGDVPTEHLRGRTSVPAVQQIAEIAVRQAAAAGALPGPRRQLPLNGLDDVLSDGAVDTADGRFAVTVRTSIGPRYLVRVSREPLGDSGESRCAGPLRPTPLRVGAIEAIG